MKGFWKAPGTSQVAPRSPKGAQKSTRNRFFGQKGCPEIDSLSICVRKSFFHSFYAILQRFFTKNQRKIDEKSMHVFVAAGVFFNLPTLMIVCILHIESHFCIFCVLAFCPEKKQKIDSEIQNAIYVAKTPKCGPRGPIVAPKMLPN